MFFLLKLKHCYNIKLFGQFAIVLLIISILSGNTHASMEEDIKIITEGPSICLTSQASNFSIPQELLGSGGTISSDHISCRRVIDATVSLGDAGSSAREAINVLLQKYPKAIHVEVLNNLEYIAGAGTFEDWLMTKTMATRNRIELNPPFGAFKIIDPCSEFIEVKQDHEILNKVVHGGKMQSATVSIRVYYIIYAGACALSRISGINLGTEQARWLEHYNSGIGSASPVTSAPPRDATVTSYRASMIETSTNLSYAELLEKYPLGNKVEIRLFNGSVLIGNLASLNDQDLQVNIPGTSAITVKRQVIHQVILSQY